MSQSEVVIHIVTAENSNLLDEIDDDVFDNAVQPDLLAKFLEAESNLLVVAIADGKVIGMASALVYLHPDKPLQLFINEVGVSSRFQRKGIGKLLVDSLLERGRELGCPEAWVATEVNNIAARALYESTGGKEDEEQAVVYVYPLRQAGAKSDA